MFEYTIVIGDSRKMEYVKDDSIHLIITSPPYGNIKDYGHPNQIGFHPDFKNDVEKYFNIYLSDINLVWKECFRVLREGCKMIVNVGDVFLSSTKFGRYRILPIHSYIINQCINIGFDYFGAIIWQKISSTTTSGGVNANFMGSYLSPRNGIIPFDYEYILIFKKVGKEVSKENEIKEKSKLTKKEWIRFFKGHWNIKGEPQKEGHPAVFPIEIPNRLIKMYSFYGETILDPFLGRGTTMLSARNLNRNCIGVEINKKFLPLIKNKVKVSQSSIFEELKFTIIEKT